MAPTKKDKVSDTSEKAAAGNKTNKAKAPANPAKRHGALSLLLSEGARKSKEELEDDEYSPATKKRKSAPKKKVTAETPSSLTWVSPVLPTPPKARNRSPELTAEQRYVIDTAFVNRPNNRSVMSAQDYNLLFPAERGLTDDQTRMLLDEGTVIPSDLTLSSNSFNVSEPEQGASSDNVSAFSFPDDLDDEAPKSAPAVMQSDAASDALFSNFIDTSMLTGGPGPTIRATPSLDLSNQTVTDVPYGTGLPTPVSAGGHQSDNSIESIAWSNSMSTLPGLEYPALTLPSNMSSSPPGPVQPNVVQEMRSVIGRFEEILNAAYSKVQNDRVTDALLAAMETRIQDLETKNSKDQQNVYVQFNKCLTYLGQKISHLEQERERTHEAMQRLVQQIQAIQHRLAPRQGPCIPQIQIPQAKMPGN